MVDAVGAKTVTPATAPDVKRAVTMSLEGATFGETAGLAVAVPLAPVHAARRRATKIGARRAVT
jgi:hypothetical protein